MGSERRLCLWTAASSLLRLGTFSCVSYRTACALVPLSSLSLLFSSRLSLSLSPPRAPLSSVPFSSSLSLSLSLYNRFVSFFFFFFVLFPCNFFFRNEERKNVCEEREERGLLARLGISQETENHTSRGTRETRKRREKKRRD